MKFLKTKKKNPAPSGVLFIYRVAPEISDQTSGGLAAQATTG
jgi:hypothetical protein